MRAARRRWKSTTLGLVAAASAVCSCSRETPLVVSPASPPSGFSIRNVRVFDSAHAVLLTGLYDVTVQNGRVADVAPVSAEGGPAPGPADIDGQGGTLLPGLVDVHTHTASSSGPVGTIEIPDIEANLAAFLYAGVTTVLDLGDLTPGIFEQKVSVNDGSMLGPHMYAAGPVFTAPGGHPAEVLREFLPSYLRWYVVPRATREVGDPSAAVTAVQELVPSHPDILKIAIDAGADGTVPNLPRQTLEAITAAGHKAEIRSIAHIGDSAEALLAVSSGVDALAHEPWREEISDEAVAAIAAAHIPVVVTLSIFDLAGAPRRSLDDFLPIERDVATPEQIAALLAPAKPNKGIELFGAKAASTHDARRRSVAKLRAAGVTVLAGSDACNPGQLPGAGLHRELAAMVSAGMTPGEALRAATFDNARFLAGNDVEFGEIAPGRRADLLLVSGSPTTDLADLAKIRAVVLNGVPLQRNAGAQR